MVKSQAPEPIEVFEECRNKVLVEGPGSLHSIMISNAGCCMFQIWDGYSGKANGGRLLMQMMPCFAGSFFREQGFNERLTIDVCGATPAHLHIQVRRVPT